ncbi:MAG: class I SAM-dependent methyltransferase [Ruminococcaceae bacterium]|nr:class I SAM-dependent methyltransferase [Oscillospiraceae bacterium]
MSYSAIAECYDALNSHVDYEAFASFLNREIRAGGISDGSIVLDLACGTGNITLPLLKRGYDMIGVDLSDDMLNIARNKKGGNKVLWLCQDMRSFELYGTVGAVVCCLDSINYLTSQNGLGKCFSLVHNYLDPNGIFIFDVNTPYKFEHIYGNNHYILEDDGIYCGWQNYFDKKSGLCDFELSFFYENGDGSYTRLDETQTERCYSIKTVTDLLIKNGFEIIKIISDFEGSPLKDTDERAYFVCRAIK